MKAVIAEARRFLSYGIAGLAATASHYATMMGLVWAMGGREVLASSLGFIVGALVKYPLNYWLVFASRQHHRVAVPRFVISLALSFALNAILLALSAAPARRALHGVAGAHDGRGDHGELRHGETLGFPPSVRVDDPKYRIGIEIQEFGAGQARPPQDEIERRPQHAESVADGARRPMELESGS